MGQVLRIRASSGLASVAVWFILLMWISTGHSLNQVTAPINNKDSPSTASHASTADNIEYYFEHMITQKDASTAFNAMADELINKETPAWCPVCTKTVVRYCLDHKMLQDHCCCDSGHARDTLPWLPHSCYVGNKCEPNIGSCVMYSEVRECCCDRIMAKQWRSSNSASSVGKRTSILISVLCALGIVLNCMF